MGKILTNLKADCAVGRTEGEHNAPGAETLGTPKSGNKCRNSIGVRGGGAAALQCWKITGQAQVAQKSWMIKYIYSIQWKISGQLFFKASVSS